MTIVLREVIELFDRLENLEEKLFAQIEQIEGKTLEEVRLYELHDESRKILERIRKIHARKKIMLSQPITFKNGFLGI